MSWRQRWNHSVPQVRRPPRTSSDAARSGSSTSVKYPRPANAAWTPSPDHPPKGVAATPIVHAPVAIPAIQAASFEDLRDGQDERVTPPPNAMNAIVIATSVRRAHGGEIAVGVVDR